jgi:hypothetical protein
MRWAGHVAHTGEDRKVFKVLVGKPEGKGPLRRPWRRWKDVIRMDIWDEEVIILRISIRDASTAF